MITLAVACRCALTVAFAGLLNSCGGDGDGKSVLPQFGHVLVVVEENADLANVVDNQSIMPFLEGLANQYGVAMQYYANTHPSIGNYMMLTTGQLLTGDSAATPDSFPVDADNVVRQLTLSGKTWRAYAEDLPAVGYTGPDVGFYAVRHVPFAFFSDVRNSDDQKKNLVPFTQFSEDLRAGQLPQYSFVIPNACNDAHDCGLDVADRWLQLNLEPLLEDPEFKADGLLIITFDEAATDNTHGGGHVATLLISPAFSKRNYVSQSLYQHESTLRLTLEALGVTSLPGAAATAPPMDEFFCTADVVACQ